MTFNIQYEGTGQGEYRGFDFHILRDDMIEDPFTSCDCFAPMLTRSFILRNTNAITGHGIEFNTALEYILSKLTYTFLIERGNDVCKMLGLQDLEHLSLMYVHGGTPLVKGGDADAEAQWVDTFKRVITDRLCETNLWRELLSLLCTDIPHLSGDIHGDSQGEQWEYFVLLTDDFLNVTGVDLDPANLNEVMAESANVYGWYVTGQCYGVEIKDVNGELLTSCWGFYGPDHSDNGIDSFIKGTVDLHLRELVNVTRYHCDKCWSKNVMLDAVVQWNHRKQEWLVNSVYDHGQCRDCDNEEHIIPITCQQTRASFIKMQETVPDRIRRIADHYKDVSEGLHNALWQILFNESVKDESVCFMILQSSFDGDRVNVVLASASGGYIPSSLWFKKLEHGKLDEIIRELNLEVFGLQKHEAIAIVDASFSNK